MSNPKSNSTSTAGAIVISAVAIALVCAKAFAQARFQNLKFDDATTTALVILAAAPWLARLFELIKFGDFEFKFQKLEENQQQHETELREHAKYLAQLFNGLVGDRGRELGLPSSLVFLFTHATFLSDPGRPSATSPFAVALYWLLDLRLHRRLLCWT